MRCWLRICECQNSRLFNIFRINESWQVNAPSSRIYLEYIISWIMYSKKDSPQSFPRSIFLILLRMGLILLMISLVVMWERAALKRGWKSRYFFNQFENLISNFTSTDPRNRFPVQDSAALSCACHRSRSCSS